MPSSSKLKKDFFDEIADSKSLMDIGISTANILRGIEILKVKHLDVTPSSLAVELGIPKAFIYADLEVLELIYRNSPNQNGADKVIEALVKEIKSYKRKNNRLKNQIDILNKDGHKNFNDGFAKGAAMNFSQIQNQSLNTKEKDILWAKGLLYIEPSQRLTLEDIKRAYRRMITMIHPDKSGDKGNELMILLQKAVEILEKYL